MAKKQTKAPYQGDPGDEHIEKVAVKETVKPVMETPKPKKEANNKPEWELKNRTYYLADGSSPISRSIKAAGIFYFDEALGYEREIKYCENQRTCFVDEMKGEQRMSHIIFRNGVLTVPKNKQTLQKLLSLYHPHANSLYKEIQPQKEAADAVEMLELEVDALIAAKNLDIDMAEAVLRVEIGSEVSKMSSKELKRDLLLYAKSNPGLFLDLINDDNVSLRNFGIKATEVGLLKLSKDQRTFTWGSNNRKLMNVPFDEHPYTALASWFKTDEGMEIYSNIEKQLK